MARPRIFSMVHLNASSAYTYVALKSFFSTTQLDVDDSFILIDNDQSFPGEIDIAGVSIYKNEFPKGFAQNMNAALRIAKEKNADLYFLNNDLVFTPGWDKPLREEIPAILSPLSNREVQYEASVTVKKSGHAQSKFETRLTMQLEEYVGSEDAFNFIASAHRHSSGGLWQLYVLPFFCVKVPVEIYSKLGALDESFGKAGAEDYDYCLRAYLAGFSVSFALGSYVLHFGGRSSYAGGETEEEQIDRERKFKSRFEEKWGEVLFRTILLEDTSAISQTPELLEADQTQNLAFVIKKLMPHKTVDPLIPL